MAVRSMESDPPADGDSLTLDELAAFIEEAKTAGVPGETRPSAVTKIGSGRVKKLQIKG